ncbi:Cell adhesion molecule 1 [Eumeta japonica]|uniref:Cell adhesion molecule 1 n=1 Tax=Eumeta variegata TaxID=151549 RepID=A0A4C1Y250_EUMVA|nr:Cell adhesion molecule 1 [Eumeta japonica]
MGTRNSRGVTSALSAYWIEVEYLIEREWSDERGSGVDFRNGPPVHWAVVGEFDARTHFVLNESDPGGAHLAISKVSPTDEGLYRCRVDYVDAPTRNYRVNLTVIASPEPPRIYDSEGNEILGSIAGPFREGQQLLLSCQAVGGKPRPDVSWYHGGERLARTKHGSVCQLHLPTLTRNMSGMKLKCQVEMPLLQHQVKEVTLRLYLKPRDIHVVDGGAARAGRDNTFVCSTRGSKPAPNVDWFLDSQNVDSTLTQVEVDRDVTRSILTLRVHREDNGRSLVCRVSNPWFPMNILEDSVVLKVLYPPITQLLLEEPKDQRMLREDSDVDLLCSADAAPQPFNYTFYKEGETMHEDPVAGIIVAGPRLRIRNLRRHHSAHYRCRAENTEGNDLSEPLSLNVLYRPECATGNVVQQLAAAPGGLVRARCAVTAPDAEQAGPLRFYWTYNGTAAKDVLLIPPSNVTATGSASTVIHGLPDEESGDLGWLGCWASNDVGNQRQPCLYRIVPAGLPEPPSNCEITTNDLELRCEPGHDGGLPQRFLLEVMEVRPLSAPARAPPDDLLTLGDQDVSGRGLTEAVYRYSNDAPLFPLDALSPGRYTFLVYSETPRGRSPRPAALHGVPIRREADVDRPEPVQTMTPVQPTSSGDNSVALMVGAALALVLLTLLTTLCVALVVMCRKKGRSRADAEQTVTRRNVGVSMYSGALPPAAVATVVLSGRRSSRALAARWSALLEDAPLAVLALDTRPHADQSESSISESEAHQETELTHNHHDDTETQTD